MTLAVLALLVAQGITTAQQPPERPSSQPPVANARRSTGPIHLDGHLDEPDWAAATPIGPLTQSEPVSGRPSSERTDVRVLFDGDALYVGVFCEEVHPGALISTQLQRDANLDVDDRLTIVLDPFFDHRNGFFFQVNPAGARSDGQISNNAQSLTHGLGRHLERRGHVAATDGWTAEIAIPFKTLRFKPGSDACGASTSSGRSSTSSRSTGGPRPPRNELDWQPGRRGSARRTRRRRIRGAAWTCARTSPVVEDTGRWRVHRWRGCLQEPDAGPERVGHGQHRLRGDGGRHPAGEPHAVPTVLSGEADVLSRRQPASSMSRAWRDQADLHPVLHAANRASTANEDIGGKKCRLAPARRSSDVSRTTTSACWIARDADATLPEAALHGQNLFAAAREPESIRAVVGWSASSRTATRLATGSNTLVGADARFATSKFRGDKNLSLDLFRSADRAIETTRTARLRRRASALDYPNDRWDMSRSTGSRLATTSTPRWVSSRGPAIRTTTAGRIAFQPRPERWGIRQFFFEFEPEYITNLHESPRELAVLHRAVQRANRVGRAPGVERHSRVRASRRAVRDLPGRDRARAGSYQWHRYRTEANTATKRWWVVDVGVLVGRVLRRHATRSRAWPDAEAERARVDWRLRADRNDVALREGQFLYAGRYELELDYNFTPNISWQNRAAGRHRVEAPQLSEPVSMESPQTGQRFVSGCIQSRVGSGIS